ncbi:hypothetical protein MCEMSEM23_01910 [Rhabdaerophilaceae bacterium]
MQKSGHPGLLKSGLTLALLGLFGISAPARADSIDGKWCSEDGKLRIEIKGSTGIWGRGLMIDGTYLRYTYLFTMPAGEPDAGQPVEMRFRRADQRMLVKIGGGEQAFWQTCLPEVS